MNSNGEESQKTRTYLKADNIAPANSITNPAEGEGMNGVWPVYGSISDDWSGVDSLYFSYYTGAEPDMTGDFNTKTLLDAKANEVLSSVNGTTVIWHRVDFTQAAWSYDFDTEKITSGAQSYKLIVATVDAMNNVGWSSAIYDINQDLDKPGARIIVPTAGSSTFPESMASGEATDDDGLGYIYWFIGKTDVDFGGGVGEPTSDCTLWGSYAGSNSSAGRIDLTANNPKTYLWQLTTPSGTGDFTIHIVPVDENETVGIKRTLTYTQKTF